jgi:hypothetical protein
MVLAQQPRRPSVWDLPLGAKVADLPVAEFMDYACGTNGGPPGRPLEDWSEFARCRPETNGLREVYFRYDDEMEYVARAQRLPNLINHHAGTRILNFPVILSLLFSEDGVVEGLRIATDPRVDPEVRREAHTLRSFYFARYDREGFDCRDLRPAEGETPMGDQFIKQRCDKVYRDTYRVVVDTNYFRKPGQTFTIPGSLQTTVGLFESNTRFEFYRIGIPIDRRGRE